jgi:hypothetical protein
MLQHLGGIPIGTPSADMTGTLRGSRRLTVRRASQIVLCTWFVNAALANRKNLRLRKYGGCGLAASKIQEQLCLRSAARPMTLRCNLSDRNGGAVVLDAYAINSA